MKRIKILLFSSFLQEALIEMLKPFTRYTITIQAVNDVGKGPAAWLEVITDQGGRYLPAIPSLYRL